MSEQRTLSRNKSWQANWQREIEGAYLYHFKHGDQELVVGWSVSGRAKAVLPRPPSEVLSRDGHPILVTDGVDVDLGPSPVYFQLS